MTDGRDSDLAVELHDVFHVMQVTRDTPLESIVAADLVEVDPGQESSMHRHNHAETVLYFLAGSGEVLLTESYESVPVTAGDRWRSARACSTPCAPVPSRCASCRCRARRSSTRRPAPATSSR